MSTAEILAELPRLSREDRRRILDRILEVAVPKTFLKIGVFHLQQLQSVPIVRLQRRIGELTYEELRLVRCKLSQFLHLAPPAT